MRKWASQKKKSNGRMMGAPPIFFLLRKWAPQKKKIMGSAHFLAVRFLGAQDPYIPTSHIGLKIEKLICFVLPKMSEGSFF